MKPSCDASFKTHSQGVINALVDLQGGGSQRGVALHAVSDDCDDLPGALLGGGRLDRAAHGQLARADLPEHHGQAVYVHLFRTPAQLLASSVLPQFKQQFAALSWQQLLDFF